MLIQWRDELEIGIEEIDQQHKAIFERFAQLYHRMVEGNGQDSVRDLLDFLADYIHSHFAAEETMQEYIHYPQFQEHKMLHDAFRVKVDSFVNQMQASEVTNQEMIRIHLFVKEWLVHHIMVEDRKLGVFYRLNKL